MQLRTSRLLPGAVDAAGAKHGGGDERLLDRRSSPIQPHSWLIVLIRNTSSNRKTVSLRIEGEDMETLIDTVAIVTGASAGIGRATARALLGAGAYVVLGARRRERLEALKRNSRAGSLRSSRTSVRPTIAVAWSTRRSSGLADSIA